MGTNLKFKYLKTCTLAVRKCDLLTRYLSKFVKPYYQAYIQPANRRHRDLTRGVALDQRGTAGY